MMLVIDLFFRVNLVAALLICLFLARAVIILDKCEDICLTLTSFNAHDQS